MMVDPRLVVAVAYDGLCTFEFGVVSELFGLSRPELGVDWYQLEVVSADPPPLRANGGITVDASTDLTRIHAAGTVVLPGWRDPREPPPERALAAVRQAHERGARIMSICSGVFLLAASGLLDGQRATTHWRYTDLLTEMYPAIAVEPDVLYIDNGSTLTSAGSAAGIDLGLHLIRRDFGAAVANQVARRLVVPPHRDGGQAQYITDRVDVDDTIDLSLTLDWALANLHQPISVVDLASRAGVSPRTLARRFRAEVGTTPHRWLTHQRIALAQRLLETTSLPVETVASQAGFVTAETLRHHFRRAVRTTPTLYRSQFRVCAD